MSMNLVHIKESANCQQYNRLYVITFFLRCLKTNPLEKKYTYCSPSLNINSRIDIQLMFNTLLLKCEEVATLNSKGNTAPKNP